MTWEDALIVLAVVKLVVLAVWGWRWRQTAILTRVALDAELSARETIIDNGVRALRAEVVEGRADGLAAVRRAVAAERRLLAVRELVTRRPPRRRWLVLARRLGELTWDSDGSEVAPAATVAEVMRGEG